ncbi:MAG: phosphoenolpyruvate carboxykinase [Acidobacteriota bacterium]
MKHQEKVPQSLAGILDDLKPGKVIKGLSDAELRNLARDDETTTQFGSASYVTRVRSRSAPFTRNTIDGEILSEDRDLLRGLRDHLRNKRILQIDRTMCQGKAGDTLACRLWISEEFARLGSMFQSSLGPAVPGHEPDLHVIDLPEWNQGERRILADPVTGVTFVLGSDYYGEIKKGFLRMTMYREKLKGKLGLHAGSKEVWARSRRDGRLVRSGMLFFGLSGTGKTSLTCHDLDMDDDAGEKIRVRQDDVVILDRNGFSRGTESRGFYIKTENLSPEDQKALYEACISPEAVLENAWVEKDGRVDFYNTELTGNGRAVVPVAKVINTDGDIDLETTNRIFFITRNTLVPPVARLTAEQAAVAFMLGESIKTSAADPDARGEAVREVGTNPFIIGPKGEEGNRFLEIVRAQSDMDCFLLNTGKVGEGNRSAKIRIQDTVAIIREIAREGIDWRREEATGLQVPEAVPGIEIDKFNLNNFYEAGELGDRLQELRNQRVAWLDRFPDLNAAIRENLY